MPPPRFFVALTSVGCVALVSLLLLDLNVAAATAKLIASTGFLAVALRVGALRSLFGRVLLLGLVFSWFGDAFLIGETQGAFLFGLGAFLVAHVCYIGAFAIRGVSMRWIVLGAIPVVTAAITVSLWLAPHVPAEMLVPVRAYTVVISLMLVAAIGTCGHGAPITILAGALLFFVSDLSVAALRLVETSFPTYVWGLPFYYAGQTLLALSARSRDPIVESPQNAPQENR